MKTFPVLLATLLMVTASAQFINRRQVVQRHNVQVKSLDTLASLTVGNGRFAFTVDATGLQTFPQYYQHGVPLGTQSEWGWHSFPDTVGYKRSEALQNYHLNGRDITYAVQHNTPGRQRQAADWYRQNPHRLQLGNLGFVLLKRDGTQATTADISGIHQTLDLWSGGIRSVFMFDGVPVEVNTYCHGDEDAVGVKVKSPLLQQGRLLVQLTFPYPTGAWTDEAVFYGNDGRHQSGYVVRTGDKAIVKHTLDNTTYFVTLQGSGTNNFLAAGPHRFRVKPANNTDEWWCTAQFSQSASVSGHAGFYPEVMAASQYMWGRYWQQGGIIDFGGSTDKRANELERRVILSQYLMRAQEAGEFPPQETGLTYNSWFGKPHLEMHWWHAAHWPLWGKPQLLRQAMPWYRQVSGKARALAKRQGFEGIRWQKMTDNTGDETPSSVGAFLIWQQPHYIYFAEELYRTNPHDSVLKRYKDLVFATADFMASFPTYDRIHKRYVLGKGLIPAQERFKPQETFNPTYELVYWHWALQVAQQWRIRSGLARSKKWDDVLQKLSPLPVQDGKYLFTESASDSYTNPEFRTDHPAVLGALGFLPATPQMDTAIMRKTFDWIWHNWTWNHTWGWDFPLTAMTATRLGRPDKAIEALLMDITTNTYLPNGHNYQDDRLRIYLPGNGGLLTAIAMMVAGYDGCTTPLPGIPKDGTWQVRWEGLQKMP